MRVVDRAEFLALPAGTFYCQAYEPWAFDGLHVKGETWGNDWTCLDFLWPEGNPDDADIALASGESFPCNKDYGQDGAFESGAKFMVLERDDMIFIMDMLDAAVRRTLR